MADALEGITSLTSLNGCGQYAGICAGGQAEVKLKGTELGLWAARRLERSAATLTTLDIRCNWPVPALPRMEWGGNGRGYREREREASSCRSIFRIMGIQR